MNMPSKVLELYHMHVCLSIFNLINSGETLSLNIIRMEWLITTEECLITTITHQKSKVLERSKHSLVFFRGACP